MLTLLQIGLWVLITIPFVLMGFVLTAAIASGIHTKILHRRAINFLAGCACPRCGQTIGNDAVVAASEAYARKVQEMFEDARRRGIKLRLADPQWEMRCPNCGLQFIFYPNTLKLESPSASPSKA